MSEIKVEVEVGQLGHGILRADFSHEGKPVLRSGEIRVHRGAQDQYLFECFGYGWSSPRWYDAQGNPTDHHSLTDLKLVAIATESDYRGIICPAWHKLQGRLSAEANSDELEPDRIGLVDCWRYKGEPAIRNRGEWRAWKTR